jgi:hypothetical protein
MQSCIPTEMWWWCGGSATSYPNEVLGSTPQTWLNKLSFILCGAVSPVWCRILHSTHLILIPTLINGHWREYPKNSQLTFWCSLLLSHLLPFLPRPPQFYQFGSSGNQNPPKWSYGKPKHPKHTTTMVSHLPLWQHCFAYPIPRSCFGRVCSRVGLKGLASFYCMAKKKNNY